MGKGPVKIDGTDAKHPVPYKGKPFEGHKTNFYRCIRVGGLPVSDVFSHLITTNTCHLTAIAARKAAARATVPRATTTTKPPAAVARSRRRVGKEVGRTNRFPGSQP